MNFDELISNGELTKAARVFAHEYYDSFKIEAVHKLLIERLADKCDEAIARQSATSDDAAEAISHIEGGYGYVWQWPKKRRDTIITALQAYQPWIPVSNVKPEKSGRYIAYVPEHWTAEGHKEGKVIIAYFRELNYEGRRRVWDDGVYGISGEVTHYLPLPEIPKGE